MDDLVGHSKFMNFTGSTKFGEPLNGALNTPELGWENFAILSTEIAVCQKRYETGPCYYDH